MSCLDLLLAMSMSPVSTCGWVSRASPSHDRDVILTTSSGGPTGGPLGCAGQRRQLWEAPELRLLQRQPVGCSDVGSKHATASTCNKDVRWLLRHSPWTHFLKDSGSNSNLFYSHKRISYMHRNTRLIKWVQLTNQPINEGTNEPTND